MVSDVEVADTGANGKAEGKKIQGKWEGKRREIQRNLRAVSQECATKRSEWKHGRSQAACLQARRLVHRT